MERAHVLAWPALHTANLDGWLWRSSGGGSQRANSVSTIDFSGNDAAAAIGLVEVRYRAVGMPARFQTFDVTSPPGLTDLLAARGYRESDPTTTMFKPIEPGLARQGALPEVEWRDHPWPEWQEAYLAEITENRRSVNSEILRLVPPPRRFFGCRRGGRIVATALGVVGHGCVVIECVATRTDCRRQGAARAVLLALEAWAGRRTADLLGLQVVGTNNPAVALYESLDFRGGATNRFWTRA